MCIIFLALNEDEKFPVIIAANRDETLTRKSSNIHRWNGTDIIGGKDDLKGGTWFAVNQSGGVAGLTNYQSTEDHTTRTISRGDLIPYFLEQHKQLVTSATSSEKIIEGVFSIATRISQSILQYPGFNLICGDVREPKSFVCISNRSVSCSPLPLTTGNGTSSGVGIHVLTNGLIDDPWPKAEHGRKIFQLLIRSIDSTTKNTSLAHCLFHQLLSDTTPFPLHELPQTGVSDDERLLCGPICVKGCRYGTRAMTVVISDSKTQLLIIERARQFKEGEGASGEEWAPTTEQEMQLETWTDCDIAVPLSNTFTA